MAPAKAKTPRKDGFSASSSSSSSSAPGQEASTPRSSRIQGGCLSGLASLCCGGGHSRSAQESSNLDMDMIARLMKDVCQTELQRIERSMIHELRELDARVSQMQKAGTTNSTEASNASSRHDSPRSSVASGETRTSTVSLDASVDKAHMRQELESRLQAAEDRKMQRSLDVQTLQSVVTQVHKMFLDGEQPDSTIDQDEAGSEALLSTVQSARKNWFEEKTVLQDRITKMQATHSGESGTNSSSSDKQGLRSALASLREAIADRSRFGAWLCDVHAGDEDEKIDPHAQEKEQLRDQLSKLEAELSQLKKDHGIEEDVYVTRFSDEDDDDRLPRSPSGVKFAAALDDEDVEEVEARGQMRPTRGRVGTCFVKKDAMPDDGSKSGVKFGAGASGGNASRGLTFAENGEEDEQEVEARGQMRPSRGRVGTCFVKKDALPDNGAKPAGKGLRFTEERRDDVDEIEAKGQMRPTRGRAGTCFVKKDALPDSGAKPGVQFGDSPDERGSGPRFPAGNEDVTVVEATGEMRPVRGRIATPFLEEGVMDDAQKGGKGLTFVQQDTEEVTEVEATGKMRSVRNRVGTAFIKQDAMEPAQGARGLKFAEEDQHDVEEVDAKGQMRPTRGRVGTCFVKGDAMAGAAAEGGAKGVKFGEQDVEAIEEVEAKGAMRSTLGRSGTGFVKNDAMPDKAGVKFGAEEGAKGLKFAEQETEEVEEVEAVGQMRATRGRVGTCFVKGDAMAGAASEGGAKGVKFGGQDVEAVEEVEAKGAMRSTLGRSGTGFVKNDVMPDAGASKTGPTFAEPDVEEVEARGPMRTSRSRELTPFTQPDVMGSGLKFAEQEQDVVEEVEARGQMRPTRGRELTPFTQPDVMGSGLKFAEQEQEVVEEVEARGQMRPTRGRVGTAFIKKDAMEPAGQKLDEQEPEVVEEVEGTGELRSTRGRAGTCFVKEDALEAGRGGVKFAASPADEASTGLRFAEDTTAAEAVVESANQERRVELERF